LELLVEELCFLEQAVMLSESLCRRLPGCDSVCADIMHNAIVGRASEEDWGEGSTAAGLHAEAQLPLAHLSTHVPLVLRVYQPVARVACPAAHVALAGLMCPSAGWRVTQAEAASLFLNKPPAHQHSQQQPEQHPPAHQHSQQHLEQPRAHQHSQQHPLHPGDCSYHKPSHQLSGAQTRKHALHSSRKRGRVMSSPSMSPYGNAQPCPGLQQPDRQHPGQQHAELPHPGSKHAEQPSAQEPQSHLLGVHQSNNRPGASQSGCTSAAAFPQEGNFHTCPGGSQHGPGAVSSQEPHSSAMEGWDGAKPNIERAAPQSTICAGATQPIVGAGAPQPVVGAGAPELVVVGGAPQPTVCAGAPELVVGAGAPQPSQARSHSSAERVMQVLQCVFEPHWPSPSQQEWVLHVQQHFQQHHQQPLSSFTEACTSGAAGPSPAPILFTGLPSRLYVSRARGEVRLATVLVAEQ